VSVPPDQAAGRIDVQVVLQGGIGARSQRPRREGAGGARAQGKAIVNQRSRRVRAGHGDLPDRICWSRRGRMDGAELQRKRRDVAGVRAAGRGAERSRDPSPPSHHRLTPLQVNGPCLGNGDAPSFSATSSPQDSPRQNTRTLFSRASPVTYTSPRSATGNSSPRPSIRATAPAGIGVPSSSQTTSRAPLLRRTGNLSDRPLRKYGTALRRGASIWASIGRSGGSIRTSFSLYGTSSGRMT